MSKRIQEMADVLKSRYSLIDKRNAEKFLRECYPKMKLYEFVEAYRLAYE